MAFATAGTAGTPLPLAGLAQLLACGSAWRFLYAAVRRVPQMLSPPQHRHSRGPLPPCGGRGREAPNQRGVAQDPIVSVGGRAEMCQSGLDTSPFVLEDKAELAQWLPRRSCP